ncbi:PilZ domain-containing protein [uncultured Nitratireductor sp.]|uniref:PilZ domain-containing protein n=1 Tax=uncultured Nitratireductor sp. TaxID=520953 RepID=UPI0025E1778E|nr:PilZ domain-containing protein [uncultured Nitratireductor sp.]
MSDTKTGPDPERPVPAERREAAREDAERRAKLYWKNGECMLLGVVLDFSDEGARIRFGDICAVPDAVYVEIEGSDRVRPAVIRWRSLTEIGVAFE